MKRLDEGKTSLVDFLRSIRFTHRNAPKAPADFPEQFAGPCPLTGVGKRANTEERHLIRSGN